MTANPRLLGSEDEPDVMFATASSTLSNISKISFTAHIFKLNGKFNTKVIEQPTAQRGLVLQRLNT